MGNNNEVETNKYGVPYHPYEIILANGKSEYIDVGVEEEFGDIQDCFDFADGDECSSDEEHKVGFGNDVDGHIEIVMVVDLEGDGVWEVGTENTPYKWAQDRVWCYVDNYAS